MIDRATLCLLSFVALRTFARSEEPPPGPPPLWSGKGELSFVSTSGNSRTQTLGAGLEVAWQPGVWSASLKSSVVRAEADGEQNARSFSLTLRGGRRLSPRAEAYARGDYLQNRFAGIEDRFAGEAGFSYAIFPNPPNRLRAEAGLGYTRETRLAGPDLDFPSARAALLYEWQISKRAAYSEELACTADLESSENWRIVNTGSLTADVSTVLALKFSFAILYANEPVPGFKKRDTTTSAAVVAKF